MLKVREDINKDCILGGNQFLLNTICYYKEVDNFKQLFRHDFSEQEKLEIQNKMHDIVSGKLPSDSMSIYEIVELFIKYFKKDSENEVFIKFLKMDIDIVHKHIVSILGMIIVGMKNILTYDMLDEIIKTYPEVLKIFKQENIVYTLFNQNLENVDKLLKLIDDNNIEMTIEEKIGFFIYLNIDDNKLNDENTLIIDNLKTIYNYIIMDIDNYNLNQMFLLGAVLPPILNDQYFELLINKDVFNKLEFVASKVESTPHKNYEFVKKFLKHYHKKISSDVTDVFDIAGIELLLMHICDYREKYQVDEIEKIFKTCVGRSDIVYDCPPSLYYEKYLNILTSDNVSDLFKIDYYYKNVNPILEKYIINRLQNNYGVNIIDKIISPFSNEYISLLNNKHPKIREKLYNIFSKYIKNKMNIENDDYNHYIEQLFIKFVDGKHIYAIAQLKTPIEMIAFLKMHYWTFNLSELTEEQIININVKHVFKLLQIIEEKYEKLSEHEKERYNLLLIKCYLIFGFDRAKIVLKNIDRLNELEHLFDNVDVSEIHYDNSGNLILNKKFINIYMPIFKEKDKNIEAYNLFSEIYNNYYDLIKNLQEDSRTLPKIIKLYIGRKFYYIGYPPNYYRLMEQLTYIPNNEVVKKNIKWYEIMKLRYQSNIPKVSGRIDNWRFEMLDLDDPLILTVGKRTHCCFLLDGVSRSSLKHAMTADNGKVFVVFENDQVIAQSWVWRDGNILCFDNVEGLKSDKEISKCYVEAIDKIIRESKCNENEEEQIKMVTIGIHESDLKYEFAREYPNIVSENHLKDFSPLFNFSNNNWMAYNNFIIKCNDIYSDARRKQCVIYKDDNFEISDNKHINNPIYLDARPTINKNELSSQDELMNAEYVINAINYELDLPLITEENLKIGKKIYYSKDWYIFVNNDGSIYSNIYSIDPRAYNEYEQILHVLTPEKEAILVKK